MKCVFDKENINPEIPGILLLSHNQLAVAMVGTVNMICGETENLAAFSFEEEDNVTDYTEAFISALKAMPEGSVVLTDIFGGSPCNQLMIYAKQHNMHISALAGLSLPMVVTAINSRDYCSGDELLQAIKDEAEYFTVDITEKLSD